MNDRIQTKLTFEQLLLAKLRHCFSAGNNKAASSTRRLLNIQDRLHNLFLIYDRENRGYLTRSSLKRILGHIVDHASMRSNQHQQHVNGKLPSFKQCMPSRVEVSALIQLIDLDNSGKASRKNFVKFFSKELQRMPIKLFNDLFTCLIAGAKDPSYVVRKYTPEKNKSMHKETMMSTVSGCLPQEKSQQQEIQYNQRNQNKITVSQIKRDLSSISEKYINQFYNRLKNEQLLS